ncbi:hypothetical protein CAEBREN_20285 [Caenorhabditis brenneri]|uniref:DUF38 domain-containing protein n=1 Tax=Caenorhabditis brenneri TaxID=135651 RepID=G0N316_CAEBE|nr:hypothetical protein CAEBREN_20285 [Caenorhabditis brenneri]
MSNTSTGDPGKPMEKPSEDLSEAMRQLSVTTYDSHETSGPFVVIREDFKKAAFDDLACTLKNPKLQLEEFSVHVSYYNEIEKNNNEIRNLLELLDHQLSVKKVDYLVFRPSCLLSILPFLKSGVLEKISLSFDYRAVDWSIDSTGMDQIALLEQWKQAEELELRTPFDKFPMEYATHFKRFEFDESFNMDRNKFIRIKNFLTKLDNFEQCNLSCLGSGFRRSISKLLGASVSGNGWEKVFHHPIPDSDHYFEIKLTIFSFNLKITKKKREIH